MYILVKKTLVKFQLHSERKIRLGGYADQASTKR